MVQDGPVERTLALTLRVYGNGHGYWTRDDAIEVVG